MSSVRLHGFMSGGDRGPESGGPILLSRGLQLRSSPTGVHSGLVGLDRGLVRSLAVLRGVGLVSNVRELLLRVDDSLEGGDTLRGPSGRGCGGLLLGDGLLKSGLASLLANLVELTLGLNLGLGAPAQIAVDAGVPRHAAHVGAELLGDTSHALVESHLLLERRDLLAISDSGVVEGLRHALDGARGGLDGRGDVGPSEGLRSGGQILGELGGLLVDLDVSGHRLRVGRRHDVLVHPGTATARLCERLHGGAHRTDRVDGLCGGRLDFRGALDETGGVEFNLVRELRLVGHCRPLNRKPGLILLRISIRVS